MKKSLIALAALAATSAFAQSSVQVVGTFDPSFVNQQTTYGDGKAVTQQLIRNNTQGTSQITFKGTEDLGGGLKANFLLENDFDAGKKTDSGAVSQFGALGGEQFLNLEGGFGKVYLGAPNTVSLFTQSSSQPFGTKIGSGFGAANTGRVRFDNTVQYYAPNIAGFQLIAGYSTPTKATAAGATQGLTSTGAVTDIGVLYNNGPLSAGVSAFSQDATPGTAAVSGSAGTATKNTQTNAYVKYDFGVATLGLGYFVEKQDVTNAAAVTNSYQIGKIDSTAYNVGAWVPLSANLSLLGSYTKKDDKTTYNLDRTVSAVGLKYTLSKNTSVYARYIDDKISNVDTAKTAFAAKVQTTAIGMQTNF